MKKFKIGIVGCGRIGSILEEDPLRGKPCTHAGGFSALPTAQLSAGCDIDPERLQKFGKRWNVTQLYSDYQDMLNKESLDIVCIATWTPLHAKMTLKAAEAGVKGIFCEKPIAKTQHGTCGFFYISLSTRSGFVTRNPRDRATKKK